MDTFRKNIIPRVSVAVWVLLALGLSLGASQEQWYQTTVDNQVTDICWSDMVMDRQGVPVIAFLRNGACPGPYVANWETDHWAVEALLPECLDSFDCARPVSVPIDLAVDSQNNPHVVFGTNRPGAQYFRRENQQWVGNTISLSAYPVALAIDTDDTPTVVLLSSLFDEGVGQDHWIARKTAETWTIEGVGTFEEAGSHQLRIGPAGDIFIGFQKGRSLTLLKKNGAVFQEIFL
ncbi:MAG: hypothetical protein IPN90_11190 [Elusimicrobia bacterium]|nr:hypothetical protein [Elusimicrobiota bacterium]